MWLLSYKPFDISYWAGLRSEYFKLVYARQRGIFGVIILFLHNFNLFETLVYLYSN